MQGPACLAVKPLDLHVVIVGSIPTGPTHGEMRLQPHPVDVLKSTPNVRKSPRSGLNLEGRLSDPQIFRCTALKRARIQAHHKIWNGIVDGIRSAIVRWNSTLITELSTPNIIAALQQDRTQTVVQRQLQEGIAQLPGDVWKVSNLAAPDKRTRDTAKLETEEPAAQRRRQIDRIKERFRPSKRVVRRKATQRKKKMRQVILDSIFTAAQSEAAANLRMLA